MTDPCRFLLMSRVGIHSLHSQWLAGRQPHMFDVFISGYHPDVVPLHGDGVMFEQRPGSKVAGYAEIFRAHHDVIARYDYVAIFDDDLDIDAIGIARLFAIVAEHGLKIAQPALTHDSYFTYGALLQDRAWALRYVNYVEMMCPVFSRDALVAAAPLFDLGFESGIDLIWCNLVSQTPLDCAVIDTVPVRHTRPVGGAKAANGFVGGRRYEDDIDAVLKRFKLPWLSCVPYAGRRKNGRMRRHRLWFVLSSLALLPAIWRGTQRLHRARSIAVYWKHLAHRRARNIPVTIGAHQHQG